VESPHPVRDVGIAEGHRLPIDQSACSRVLSAFSGQKGAELDRVRRAVTSFAHQSARAPGTAAIACPVFAVGQRLVGALLLSGPESRFTNKTVAQMRAALVNEASRLTLDLGGDPAVYVATGSSTLRSEQEKRTEKGYSTARYLSVDIGSARGGRRRTAST
jgi:DNA-binding IclR family transcriptional regulator